VQPFTYEEIVLGFTQVAETTPRKRQNTAHVTLN